MLKCADVGDVRFLVWGELNRKRSQVVCLVHQPEPGILEQKKDLIFFLFSRPEIAFAA